MTIRPFSYSSSVVTSTTDISRIFAGDKTPKFRLERTESEADIIVCACLLYIVLSSYFNSNIFHGCIRRLNAFYVHIRFIKKYKHLIQSKSFTKNNYFFFKFVLNLMLGLDLSQIRE